MSIARDTFAYKGVAIWGIVYVPMPAYQSCQWKEGGVKGTIHLVVNQLLFIVALVKEGEKLYDIRVVAIKLIASPIETENESSMLSPLFRTGGNDWSLVPGMQTVVFRRF